MANLSVFSSPWELWTVLLVYNFTIYLFHVNTKEEVVVILTKI